MATFPIAHRNYLMRIDSAKKLTRVLRSTGATIADARANSHTAADGITLRGIPAIGLGVAGHIPGTQPESAATR
jgi:hypothetical protein